MRALVTGGAGFIGSRLVKKLSDAGHDVISLDKTVDEKKFLEQDYCCLDLSNYKHLTKLSTIIEGVDVVYHLAGKKNLQESFDRVLYYHNANVVASLNLLELCVDRGVKRFVFASSASVYSEPDEPLVTEESAAEPASPYGLQKLTVENYCKIYSRKTDLDTVSLRYFNLYGPDTNQGVVGAMLNKHKNKEKLTIFGTGENSRDFIHVDDIVDATIAAGEHNLAHNGEVYNVGFGEATSVNDIALSICKDDKKITRLPAQQEVSCIYSSIDKITKNLGWKPKTHVLDWLSSQ